ncbi:hypothetical protein AAH678_22690 [Sodalis endosymbiont of Spalangia cameroni]|uniref:hypothetical protein n=1 Tax=Sodalis praecaptivus TaxID=1239307 RepID=UPI0031F89294
MTNEQISLQKAKKEIHKIPGRTGILARHRAKASFLLKEFNTYRPEDEYAAFTRVANLGGHKQLTSGKPINFAVSE